MNIVLWILQVLVAFMATAGSVWRFMNYDSMAKDIPSVQALPQAAWAAVGVFEVACALGLILPGILKKQGLTSMAATGLAVEMLLITGLHLAYFGFKFEATNPACWSFGLCLVSAFIAYGRKSLIPN
jgi:uncharacterized membrane protein